LALLAVESARLGAIHGDFPLLEAAESAAKEARRLADQLPGQPPWSAQADAAEARIALARGDNRAAVELGRSALNWLHSAHREDPHFEILLPAARSIIAGGEADEQARIIGELQLNQAFGAARIMDEQVRVRWFRGPVGSELTDLAGPVQTPDRTPSTANRTDLAEGESQLLALLVQGKSNSEIATELGVDDIAISRKLSALYARIGTSSRAETTAFAFRAA